MEAVVHKSVYYFLFQFSLVVGYSVLVGYLSQYFCMKRTLEDELTLLRNVSSGSIPSKQEEIDDATKDAYLYAIGVILVVVTVAFINAWLYYLAQNIGMQARIIAVGAIYNKVFISCKVMCTHNYV